MTYLERAIQQIEAVMNQPPLPPMPDDELFNRLLAEVVRLTEENRELRRQLREHTNGPAANGAVVTLEKEEERTDA